MASQSQGHCTGWKAEEPIAIVGLGLKLPGDATDPEKFWDLLISGKSARSTVPPDRYNVNSYATSGARLPGTLSVRHGHFLEEDVACFDAPFFSISPAEAACIDPQHRLLLEVTYQALENAGIPIETISGSDTSVFAGCFNHDYESIVSSDIDFEARYKATGNALALVANRVSWFFNLRGPSVSVDTACSSSLTALHLACQSLSSGESSTSIVGGCNLILTPYSTMAMECLSCISPDGICYSFDSRANGYSRGEGIAAVILKPLHKALSDGDTIRGIIRGSGINQDGHTSDIAQPDPFAQQALIRQVYAKAGLSLRSTDYIEAHATGTSVGDSTELNSIFSTFKDGRTQPLYIGGVKSNIGHLEATSGLAGLIKTLLILEKGHVPPTIRFREFSSRVKVDENILKIPTSTIPWPGSDYRRASVNSYGFGGANAHVILDDVASYLRSQNLAGNHYTINAQNSSSSLQDASSSVDDSKPTLLFPFSAADEGSLSKWIQCIKEYLKKNLNVESTASLRDLAFTFCCKRSRLRFRSYLLASSAAELLTKLEEKIKSYKTISQPDLVFIFTGQGAQWCGMGRELCRFSAFRKSLLDSTAILTNSGWDWDLIEVLSKSEGILELDKPEYSQPICTALQIALVDLLTTLGVMPKLAIGHSSGEIAAAYCAGALSKLSALKVALERGRCLKALLSERHAVAEAMIVIGLSSSKTTKVLKTCPGGGHDLSIACINSPNSTTVSGPRVCIEELKTILTQQDIFCRILKVNVAYHSPFMNVVGPTYEATIQGLECRKELSHAPIMVSSVTGEIEDYTKLSTSGYWVQNLVSPVLFSKAVATGIEKGFKKATPQGSSSNSIVFVEVGPHSTLKGPLREIIDSLKTKVRYEYTSMLSRGQSAMETALNCFGFLDCQGYNVRMDYVADVWKGDRRPLKVVHDLPPYPFNHGKRYWFEPRLSKNMRFANYPYNHFLGRRPADWNSLEPKWRQRIEVKNLPWVADHMVLGSVVYPAAGFLVMAIEAVLQLHDYPKSLKGIKFRDVTISKALVVPKTDAMDVEFFLRPQSGKGLKSTEWYIFRLCSFEGNEWFEICKGSVCAEMMPEEGTEGLPDGQPGEQSQLSDKTQGCDTFIGVKQFYDDLKNLGIQYGPSFRGLKDIYSSRRGKAVANFDPQLWTKHVTSPIYASFLHPSALDAIFQVGFATRTNNSASMPILIRELWLSGSNIELVQATEPTEFQVTAEAQRTGFRNTNCFLEAKDKRHGAIVATGEIYSGAVGEESSELPPEDGLTCFKIESKPELAAMNKAGIKEYCLERVKANPIDIGRCEQLTRACMLACETVSALVDKSSLSKQSPHLLKYYDWIKAQASQANGHLSNGDIAAPATLCRADDLEESLLRECKHVEALSPSGRLVARCARNIKRVLMGEIGALELLFQDDLAEQYYQEDLESTSVFNQFECLLDLMAHKNPSLRILEVGAGTGSATERVLKTLLGDHLPSEQYLRCSEYHYTDITPSFFEKAREKFVASADRMTFKTLNLEKDPKEQGFEEGYYDLIIAANVLHATSDLSATLGRVRRLLSNTGKLVMFECIHPRVALSNFIFGMLPGWWLGVEPERSASPLLTESQWHEYLQREGFRGVETILLDKLPCDSSSYSELYPLNSVIMSSVETPPESHGGPPQILISKESRQQSILAQILKELYLQRGYSTSPEIITIDIDILRQLDFHDFQAISLLELDKSLLSTDSEEVFSTVRSVISSAKQLLWVTGSDGVAENPKSSLATGAFRCIQGEVDRQNLCLLHLCQLSDLEEAAGNIADAFDVMCQETDEIEFIVKNGLLQTKRLVPAPAVSNHIRLRTTKAMPRETALAEHKKVSLTVGTLGLLDTMQFSEDSSNVSLGVDEIEIDVKASGINFRDVLIALGQVDSCSLGSEAAGIVTQVGDNYSNVLKPGDRVCGALAGSLGTSARGHAGAFCIMPDDVPFTTAATLPIVFGTADYCLFTSARIQKGEKVLVHSGAGGFGQACIQLAKAAQAEIFATAGTAEKREFLNRFYGIPMDHIFSSRDSGFKEKIRKGTGGYGIDVVINSLAGELLRASWELIAVNGRFIEVGKTDIFNLGSLPMWPFHKGATFSSVDLSKILQDTPQYMGRLLVSILERIKEGTLSPPEPLQVFQSYEIGSAFRKMQSGKSQGKMVIEFDKDHVVPVVPNVPQKPLFKAEATYLLAGGLGGIGRSIARWMADHGARSFLLPSRSGPSSTAAQAFVNEMRNRGIRTEIPQCDISEEQSLKDALLPLMKDMPPIDGCIQCAMDLNDMRFDTMSLSDFQLPLAAKVRGSWNLLQLLPPRTLSFTIFLASVSGVVGTHGQANYAAGNTYQDALAEALAARGERHAVALDLGNFQSIGRWERFGDEDFARAVGARDYRSVSERELHAVLEHFCDPAATVVTDGAAQVVVGLDLPSRIRRRGLEDPYWMARPLMRHFYAVDTEAGKAGAMGEVGGGTGEEKVTAAGVAARLPKAATLGQATEAIVEGLREKLARTLGIEPAEADPAQTMNRLGVDSLAAVEVRTWFKNAAGADVAVFEILGSSLSMEACAGIAAARSKFVDGALKEGRAGGEEGEEQVGT